LHAAVRREQTLIGRRAGWCVSMEDAESAVERNEMTGFQPSDALAGELLPEPPRQERSRRTHDALVAAALSCLLKPVTRRRASRVSRRKRTSRSGRSTCTFARSGRCCSCCWTACCWNSIGRPSRRTPIRRRSSSDCATPFARNCSVPGSTGPGARRLARYVARRVRRPDRSLDDRESHRLAQRRGGAARRARERRHPHAGPHVERDFLAVTRCSRADRKALSTRSAAVVAHALFEDAAGIEA